MASEEIKVNVEGGPGLAELEKIVFEPEVVLHRGNRVIKTLEREVNFKFNGFLHEGLIIDQASTVITRYGRNTYSDEIDGELKSVHIRNTVDIDWVSISEVRNLRNPEYPAHCVGSLPRYFHGRYSYSTRLGLFIFSHKSWMDKE
ncbi:MAG: hypothetical protein V1804_04460 [Patescibacteria group bacterium]